MLKIYNTLGGKLEVFKAINEHKVSFYQCGPTVYSRQHIGNLFSSVKGDLIRRSLMYLGYDVKFVRNITDVGHLVSDEDSGEDKMEKGAKKEGIKPEEIAKKYTDLYHQDIYKLNVLDPDVETIATQYVTQMESMVQILLDKGFAYATDLAIYFDVSKFKNYTQLSGQKLDLNKIGAGHGDISDPQKKNAYDFAVWFFKSGSHKNAIQVWEHKFNEIEQKELKGFPGWHIECSAMSKSELGDTIDIHMGGREHIPVHHTNEIAQSEAANGVKFTNYWLHHELLLIDDTKMSKSLGNIYTLDDLKAKGYEPLIYRYFLLQSHYRSKQNFTWEALDSAKSAYEKILNKVVELKSEKEIEKPTSQLQEDFQSLFKQSLEDDFNIPKALSVFWDMLKAQMSQKEKLKNILDFDKVLGLSLNEKSDELLNKNKVNIPIEAQELIDQREKARKERNWVDADRIRDELLDRYQLIIRDTENGIEISKV